MVLSLDHYFLHRMRKNEGNGDEVKLTEAEFRRLADRFLAEIESRY
jgi:hypothetical protein